MSGDQVDVEPGAQVQSELHVYVLPPAEHWYGWHDLSRSQPDDIFPKTSSGMDVERHFKGPRLRAEIDHLLYNGRKLAEATLGYDGDVASGPYFSMIPSFPAPIPLVAWTQASRGLVFVASPVALPHLTEFKEAADLAPEITKRRRTFG